MNIIISLPSVRVKISVVNGVFLFVYLCIADMLIILTTRKKLLMTLHRLMV